MPGRAGMTSISAVKSDMNSIKAGGTSGVSGSEVSAIGGAGRNGADGEGNLNAPTYRKPNEAMPMTGGNATAGETGMNSGGAGKSF